MLLRYLVSILELATMLGAGLGAWFLVSGVLTLNNVGLAASAAAAVAVTVIPYCLASLADRAIVRESLRKLSEREGD
jgi:pheromone shutdown protein TraB